MPKSHNEEKKGHIGWEHNLAQGNSEQPESMKHTQRAKREV